MTVWPRQEQGDVRMTLGIQTRQQNDWHWLERLSSCWGPALPPQTERLSLTLMRAAADNAIPQLWDGKQPLHSGTGRLNRAGTEGQECWAPSNCFWFTPISVRSNAVNMVWAKHGGAGQMRLIPVTRGHAPACDGHQGPKQVHVALLGHTEQTSL